MKIQKQGNFSLIELLIVVAIIAILAGLLLPALNKARGMGLMVVCQGKCKTIGQALNMYSHDFDDRIPLDPYYIDSSKADSPPFNDQWMGYLSTRVKEQYGLKMNFKSFGCPALPEMEIRSSTSGSLPNRWKTMYIGNRRLFNGGKISRVAAPGSAPVCADNQYKAASSTLTTINYISYRHPMADSRSHTVLPTAPSNTSSNTNKGNILFVDIHVESMSYSKALFIHGSSSLFWKKGFSN